VVGQFDLGVVFFQAQQVEGDIALGARVVEVFFDRSNVSTLPGATTSTVP